MSKRKGKPKERVVSLRSGLQGHVVLCVLHDKVTNRLGRAAEVSNVTFYYRIILYSMTCNQEKTKKDFINLGYSSRQLGVLFSTPSSCPVDGAKSTWLLRGSKVALKELSCTCFTQDISEVALALRQVGFWRNRGIADVKTGAGKMPMFSPMLPRNLIRFVEKAFGNY